ncbi:MAG: N-acetylneuraminate synthase family protein [Bacteroidota bacterium]
MFDIGKRKVSKDHDPLIVAEIGINHGGDLSTAYQMVDAACRSGVEVIKHQTHIVEDEMSELAKKVVPGNAAKSIYEIMDECSLTEDEEFKLMKYVQGKGMIFISTPFSRAAADRLAEFDIPAFKIGSGECNNIPLLEHLSGFGKPIILSTGMNDITSVKKSVIIFENKNIPVALLHTTNLYPTPFNLVRLGAMQELMVTFPDRVIGLSDHTLNNLACLSAVALGALILERHFTDHKGRHGPDIVCSMDEKECSELIESSRLIKTMLGGRKEAAEEEKVTSDFAFATVVATKDIAKGEVMSKTNVWVKRPGTGEIKAEFYNRLLGRKVLANIESGTHLNWDQVEK